MTSIPSKPIDYSVRDDSSIATSANRAYNMLAGARARQFETNFERTAWQPRVNYQSEAHNIFRSSRMPMQSWLDQRTRRFMQIHTSQKYRDINTEKLKEYGVKL